MPVGETTNKKYRVAIRDTLAEEMELDSRVILMGQDIGVSNGLFRLTEGLFERFGPERVRDTPISETATVGAAIGLALVGYRPVVEIAFSDLMLTCFDTIVNQPKLASVFGTTAFVEKALQYTPPPKEKKAPAAPAQPKAEKKPKKEEADDEEDDDKPYEEAPKEKNPLDLLPKSTFNLEDWKRAYSNKDTRGAGGAIEWFYEKFVLSAIVISIANC